MQVPDQRIVSFVESYVAERADADVKIAEAVSQVKVSGRTLTVTFDPAEASMTRETFDSINAFNNPYDGSASLADFIAAPMMNSTEEATRVRASLDAVVTSYADGSDDGRRTIAELEKLNGP